MRQCVTYFHIMGICKTWELELNACRGTPVKIILTWKEWNESRMLENIDQEQDHKVMNAVGVCPSFFLNICLFVYICLF